MKKKYLTAAAILLAFTGLATSATLQNHPFSQIFPPNAALDFGGQDVANASRVETAVIEPNTSDITFKDNGNVDILVYDDSQGRWELVNSNLYLGGNLNVAGNRITNVPAPSAPGDAVNKTYADTSDDTVADDQNLQDVLSQGNSAGSYAIDMNTNAIISLADPTNAQDAATKNYVDSQDHTDDQGLSNVLGQSNDAGSTAIVNLADPSNAQDAATKSYVDTSDDTIADDQTLSDVLSQGNDAGSTAIVNLADPSNAQDAATKSYVDNNDATGTDDQTLSVTSDVSGTSDDITIESGNTVTIDDDYAANTDASTKCGSDQVLEGGDTCVTNYEAGDDGDSSSTNERQGISASGDTITIYQTTSESTSVDSATITDDTIADDQTLSVTNDTSGTHDSITINNGNTVTIDDDYQANTDSQGLSNVLSNSNDGGGTNMVNSGICPDGTCGKSNYETFDTGGIGTTSIYSGSGGEIDIQSTVMMNGNTLEGVSNIQDQSRDTMITLDDSNNDVEINGGFQLPTGTDAW